MDRQDEEYEALLRQFQPRKPSLPPSIDGTHTSHRFLWLAAAAVAMLALAIGMFPPIQKDPGATHQDKRVNSGNMQRPSVGTRPLAQALIEAFEVVSIKVTSQENSGPVQPSITLFPPGGGFRKTNTTLRMLVQLAYGVQEYQVVGGPAWVNSDRYDVEAKSTRDANRNEVLQMIQALLAERFALKIHPESKEGPVFELVVAKGGLRVQPTTDSSPADVRIGRYNGKRSMTQLAQYLGSIVDRSVIDRTGLSGTFDIHLEFTPELIPIGPNGPIADPGGPSVFTAVQDQLGLRLSSASGTVETIFIDEAQKPSPN